MLSDYEKKISLGFSWESPGYYYIPPAEDAEDAVFAFKRGIPKYAGRTLNTLESVGVTDNDAKIVIEYGKGVSSLTTSAIRTIENFGQACEYLFNITREKKWQLSKENICHLHSILSRDEVRHPGFFRKINVKIEGCEEFNPPEYTALDRIFKNGFEALPAIENIPERAIATFLFMARSQFFENANKRTAALAMTGILISNGYYPLNIDKQPGEFLGHIADFYVSADATKMFALMNEMGKEQYPDYWPINPNMRSL